jgi:hypothetical protein
LLIGFDGSLKTQVEQAKAAILYPPSSLHTLITGPTGVGKSLFASVMFNYACFVGRFDAKKPFIVFNCADYAMNPQLLMAHIFGHIKGRLPAPARTKRDWLIKLMAECYFWMRYTDYRRKGRRWSSTLWIPVPTAGWGKRKEDVPRAFYWWGHYREFRICNAQDLHSPYSNHHSSANIRTAQHPGENIAVEILIE